VGIGAVVAEARRANIAAAADTVPAANTSRRECRGLGMIPTLVVAPSGQPRRGA
jgi:hypothetical protein